MRLMADGAEEVAGVVADRPRFPCFIVWELLFMVVGLSFSANWVSESAF